MSVSYEYGERPSGGRAEARRRRRQRRRRALLVVAALAVLALLASTVYLVRSGDEAVPTTPTQRRTQTTLLLQVQAPSGAALSNALIAHDPSSGDDDDAGTGSVVLLPPQLLVNVAGGGQVRLDRTLLTVAPEVARNAVSDLVGVTIDGGWVLDLATLGKLVDGVGGIRAEVDVPVTGGPGGRVVLLNPGGQQLNGAQAAAFVAFLGEEEEEQSRLARVQEVLKSLLRELPASTSEVATLLGTLGPRSAPTFPVNRLAELLVGLAQDQKDEALAYDTLPVVKIETGGEETTFRLDPAPTRQLVDRLLAQSVPPGARQGGNRVLVLNGVGTPNIGEKVRARLVPAGLVFVGSRNAPSFDYARTLVLIPEEVPEAQPLGEKVASLLGVPATAVATSPIGSVADVIVIVGADFRP